MEYIYTKKNLLKEKRLTNIQNFWVKNLLMRFFNERQKFMAGLTDTGTNILDFELDSNTFQFLKNFI